jgi:hypothetical protein
MVRISESVGEFERPAEWNSAIQQIENLRYAAGAGRNQSIVEIGMRQRQRQRKKKIDYENEDENSNAQQNGILRYGRLKICVTLRQISIRHRKK